MNPAFSLHFTEKRDFARELKFVLPSAQAETVLSWAREHLVPDPNANGAGEVGYTVNSLYFDTPGLDVYHRKGSYGRCKYRIRRYGAETSIFLERKLKTNGRVGKRRTRVPDPEITFLNQHAAAPAWGGYWFYRRLVARQLAPQCQIAYQRSAWVGMAPDGAVRLTLDRGVRSFPSQQLGVAEDGPWIPILTDRCILELKYRTTLPDVFRGLIQQLSLQPQPISKYRLTVQAFGWGSPAPVEGQPSPRNGEAAPGEHPLNGAERHHPQMAQISLA
jgi:hypothetical protein